MEAALARVAELELPTDGRRASASSTSSDMEKLHEELKLEIQPQRLQRQYTLNVPPFSGGAGMPDVLEDVLSRWEKNQAKWRRFSSSNQLEDVQDEQDEQDQDAVAMLEDGADLFEDVNPRAETFDVTFGDGFLGLEFVFDPMKSRVAIKSVHMDTWSSVVLQIPPGVTLTRGLMVDAINGREVAAMSPEDVLDTLQFSKRPMTVKFRAANKAAVVCKLCETKVDANSLDEHTNYCVLSKRVELEADVINNSIVKLTASINAMISAQAMQSMIDPEERHIYHALRVVAIQASACDVVSVDAFALCARLVKIIDRIRQQEDVDTANFAVERGIKYCNKLRNLIHAKMSKMRATHKMMFQQNPVEIPRTPLKRTKSLEDMDNSDGLRARRRSSLKPASYRVSIRDFEIVKPISKGAFGKVYLARKKTTGDQYAIKVLAKEHLLRKKQIQQIETERNILASVVSPFVVKLFWTFQTKRNLFLVMEYLPGGDFMSLLECIVQLEEQVACVYIAEIAIALNHLHTKGCVHRDLKPDNILLSSTGHIKLTDFGLSEEAVALSDTDSEPDDESMAQEDSEILVGTPLGEAPSALAHSRPRHASSSRRKKSAYQTYGRCGTPDYLAPEIIRRKPHGPPVDYWALGIILYEMLVGFPPFNDDTVDAIFDNILEGQILWPDGEKSLSYEAMDLIGKLLDQDPATRMGWDGIKLHPFFDGINWDTILECVPPFVPTLEGPNDTSYFNNRNLTDIFIDDDEFDVATRSASGGSSQNNLDSGPESDEQALGASEPKGEEDYDAGNNNASNMSTSTADVYMSWGTAGALSALEGAGTTNEELLTDGMQVDDDNNHCRFPSGMYGSPDDANLSDAFRSFSFTNMNALAAASQAEADMITDSEQEVAGAVAGPSILI